MAYNVISCRKIAKNTQTLKIADLVEGQTALKTYCPGGQTALTSWGTYCPGDILP